MQYKNSLKFQYVLWTPSKDGKVNLIREELGESKITLVGNIMIDCFEMMRDKNETESNSEQHGVNAGAYAVMTLHRLANVDNPESLKRLCNMMNQLAEKLLIIFLGHPTRTKKNLEKVVLNKSISAKANVKLLEPQSYISFMYLVSNCKIVITDCGGRRKRQPVWEFPAQLYAQNTERPITINESTNQQHALYK